MLYAKIVLALPVEGPFDYQVPSEEENKASPGARAWVNFRGKKEMGYIVGTSTHTDILRIKPLIKIIDSDPVLDSRMLKLSKMVADYYCCCWGEAIAASLPKFLRIGKPVGVLAEFNELAEKYPPRGLLLEDLDGLARWDVYCREIKGVLAEGKTVLVLVSDKSMVLKAKHWIAEKTGWELETIFHRQPDELQEWLDIKNGQVKIVVGPRSSVFVPLVNLGLIIVDEESDSVYKQEQVPHYHSRQVALMRSDLEKAKIILCASAVSLESIHLAKQNKIELQTIKRQQPYPEVKVIDMKNLPLLNKKKNIILSRFLQDAMTSVLAGSGKILLFLNRKGFATSAVCSTCAEILKCPRCNINLVYFFDQNVLRCHYCNYKIVSPKICPQCNSGYIKFSGAGTEKIESELSRIFPQARIKRIDTGEIPVKDSADIFIATQGIIRQADFRFELTAVLAIDNSLNHVDFRSSEKVFAVLLGLLALTDKKMFIQTSLTGQYCFQAIENNDVNIFYDAELSSRKEIKFPPWRNFCQVKLRGKIEKTVAIAAEELFQVFSENEIAKAIKIISLNPGQPPKLRGNYYWVILLSTNNVLTLNNFLKKNLRNFRHSGIIVTVDVDPV